MESHYFFSQTYQDGPHRVPVCCAYSAHWLVPMHGKELTDSVLVLALTTPSQMAAAKLDPRVVVLPYLFSPEALPEAVTSAYESMGAEKGMSLAVLLAKLAESEPRFGQELRVS